MLRDYLGLIDLEEFKKDLNNLELNDFVKEAFDIFPNKLTEEEIDRIYKYDVPKLGLDGSCSLTNEKEDKPYDLARTLGLEADFNKLKEHPQTLRIWRLYQVVKKVMDTVSPNWFGIYRKIKKADGLDVLVKEAYAGAFSRAEFLLTEEFAKQSNNSTVGLTGKARYFGDLATYKGPYYECDNQVQSEYCGPILDEQGRVIGIIDAESFQKKFFTPEKILQLTKVCQDLGKINLGTK